MAVRVTIIGAGPGGYVAAARAAQLGAEVTLIEESGVGGTCLNWGCIPTKIMKRTAEILEDFHRASEFGIAVAGPAAADMRRLMARKEELIREQARGIMELLKHRKVNYIEGRGNIKSHGKVTVEQKEGQTLEVEWDRLILSMGARPLEVPAFAFDGETVLSSNDALSLLEVPKSMLIVGAGVVGCEFAFIFSALGSQVTLVEAMPRALPLPSVSLECSKTLQREMKKRKMRFFENRTLDSIEHKEGMVRAVLGPSPFLEEPSSKDRKPISVDVDKVLVCIGRTPNTARMGLENLSVRMDEKGWIVADETMQTNVPGVYAIGDVLGPSKIMLAHVASAEGLIAAENAVGGNKSMDYAVVPNAIFTMPEVANVGLTMRQAQAQGLAVRADSVLFRTLGKPQVIGEIVGQAKIVWDTSNGRVLGVHIVGPHATDIIAEGALAIQMGATIRELAETIHAHPTLPEIMLETSFKALDRSLHG